MFCGAMQDANKNRLYVHEVFVIDKIKKGNTLQTAAFQPHGGIALYRDILANVLDRSSSSESGTSSIGHAENFAPAISLQSRGDAISSEKDEHIDNSPISADKVTESSPSPQENGPKNFPKAAVKSASAEVETSPTEAQKEAGNYKRGHVKVGTFDVTIENPKGSERSGTDANGKKWSVKMNNTYGYIRGTEGVDGDHIDVFLAEDMDKWDGKYVFVVDQYNPDGTFDEHKVMLGFNSMEEARSAYLSNYEKGWENGRRIVVARIKTDGFQKWVDSSHRKTKPFAHYVIAGAAEVSDNEKKPSASKKGKPHVSKENEVKRTVEHFPMETPEEAAAFDKRVPEMKDSELLAYMQEDGKGDINSAYHMNIYDEYDYRHTDEQTEAYNTYIQQLHDSNTTREQAEEMLGNILGDVERFATDERSQLIGQSDALQDYITELERQKENERAEAENSAEVALRDAIADLMRKSGLDVLESKEGQRVLDEANGRGTARTHAMIASLTKAAYTIRGWITGNKRGKSFTIELPETTRIMIRRVMGRDFDSHNITANGVAHAQKNHGVGGQKLNKKSIPLTKADMELIPYIMTAPDYVRRGSDDVSGRVSVRFYKELSNGYVVVAEKEYKNSPDDMETITMWAEMSDKATNAQRKTAPDTHVQNAILDIDAAKIRKDAENAIAKDQNIREHRVYHGSGVRFFRTSNGEAYGFTVGGKIYVDPRIATAETPIHEYAHLWATAMREGNPTEWKNIVGLMKGTSVWAEVQKLYPELKNDDDIADEVLATFSGRRGAERLRAEQQKIMQGDGSVFEKAAAVGALARVKQALSKFWKGVADFLGIHYTSAEEVADRVMKDLLEGVDPRKFGVSSNDDIRLSTSEELSQRYGSRWIEEQTNEDGRHTTQVKNTINSYKKFCDFVKRDSNGKNVSILDASSGLGLGTEWMRENGMNVDDVEPYPSENRIAPTYTSYNDIHKKYDYIISNAVLNVIPDDWRANVLHDMTDKLKKGGKLVINVRSAESIRKQGKEGITRITQDDASEILVLRPNGSIKAYQKGFTKDELKKWCETELGSDYSVEIANEKNAGGSYDTAVVVTKNSESDNILYRQGEDTPHVSTSSESKSQAAQKATENLNLGGRVVVHESAEGLEGKEATAKGWYDTKTGQIHVVLSNNADAADVTQTILHEAVAHHGLRELFGHNVMDAFLDSVLAAASQEVKDAINELRRGNGWNFRTATEEYLAGLAERTDFERMTAEERGLFATIRRLFNRALEFLGLKNHELSDRELAYILWCSYQDLQSNHLLCEKS